MAIQPKERTKAKLKLKQSRKYKPRPEEKSFNSQPSSRYSSASNWYLKFLHY